MTTYFDETVDFRPAHPGWRVVLLLEPDGDLLIQPLAGWLVQEEVRRDRNLDVVSEYDTDGNRIAWSRRVVPAWINGDGLDFAGDLGAWTVLGPGEEEVDAETTSGMREELRERQARS